MWKEFASYTRSERRAIRWLAVGLLVLVSAYWAVGERETTVRPMGPEESAEVDSFLANLRRMDDPRGEGRLLPSDTFRERQAELFPFNPNTADSVTLRRLGLPVFVVRNLLKYRSKGGVFRTRESFAKLYGLSEEHYRMLFPYLRIDSPQARRPDPSYPVAAVRKDTFQRPVSTRKAGNNRPGKYPEGTVVDVNRCDTAELKRIPGIGSYRAALIVAYRERLGGFHAVSQLQETGKIDTSFNRWLKVVPPVALRPIRVNVDGFDRLRRHPYLNYYQSRAIVEYRRKSGKLKNLSQLALFEEFTEKDIERLAPYLSFE